MKAETRSVRPAGTMGSERRLRFDKDHPFQEAVRHRVDEYFRKTGLKPRGAWRMHVKTAFYLAAFFGLYTALVFFANAWWQVVPLTILLGLAAASIGLNIQHDAGHRAYSDHRWINRVMAATMDMIGASSYLWNVKHVVLHHAYTNVVGHDTDIEDGGFLLRMAPHQKHHWFHRWQHIYMWPLYGLLILRWQIQKDWWELFTGRISQHRFPPPKRSELGILIGGKVLFVGLAFVLPMLLHPVGTVLLCYALAGLFMGMYLSLVFQIAHCVDQADFPLPAEDTGEMHRSWALHQVETTVDFDRRSRLAAWLLGGLNFQIEHHLFPRVCHIHYPALSVLVEQTCREHGVRYAEHRSFWAGIARHVRFLRKLGQSESVAGS